jgi:hypothetical protein
MEGCAGGKQVQVNLSVRVRINDREALVNYARRRFAAC